MLLFQTNLDVVVVPTDSDVAAIVPTDSGVVNSDLVVVP